MKLFIPSLGTALKLTRPWFCPVYFEPRNNSLMAYANVKEPTKAPPMPANYPHSWIPPLTLDGARKHWNEGDWRWRSPIIGTYTWPAGTVLLVDRIYIRQGQEGYDSVTFRTRDIVGTVQTGFGKKSGKAVRFWVKLADANEIECEVVK